MRSNLLKRMLFLAICVAVMGMGMWGRPAEAQQPGVPDKAKIEAARAFFKGRSIDFIVPYAPGGGYDGKARMMQLFMEKYIPGVKVLVKNMPGAGSMVATNQMYVTKPDGLTIAILSGVGMVANTLGEIPIVKFDVTKYTFLGRVNAERRFLLAGLNSKVKDLESLLKSSVPVRQALTGPGSGSYAVSQIVLKALGFPRQEIIGYQSSEEAELGVIRGEADIHLSSESSLDVIQRKEVRAIVQLAPENIEILRDIPNLFTKDIEKLNLSEGQLKRIRFAADLMALGYIIGAPPQVPPERAWVLEEAVQKTIRDPEFVALGKKSGFAPNLDPLTGKEITELVNRLLNIPPDLKAEMKQLMKAK